MTEEVQHTEIPKLLSILNGIVENQKLSRKDSLYIYNYFQETNIVIAMKADAIAIKDTTIRTLKFEIAQLGDDLRECREALGKSVLEKNELERISIIKDEKIQELERSSKIGQKNVSSIPNAGLTLLSSFIDPSLRSQDFSNLYKAYIKSREESEKVKGNEQS